MKTEAKYQNTATVIFPSKSQNESFARSFVSAFISQYDPTIEEAADLKCAVSEAVTNSIVHGYREKDGNIKIKASITKDNVAVIEVIDKGCGIEDVSLALQPLFTTNTDGDRSGMGFTVIETFTDKMKVYSKVGRGTRVRFEKKLGKSDT